MERKIAILGASGGIGSALVRHYSNASNQNRIYAFSRRAIAFDHPQIEEHCVDFDNEQSIAKVAKLENWDLVIVAIGILSPAIDITPEKTFKQLEKANFLKLLETNTIIPALIAKHFIPNLKKHKNAILAILSARIGSISDNRLGGWYTYRCSKAATNMLIKTLSIENKHSNQESAIIGLHPGTVDTNLSSPFKHNVPKEKLFTPEQSAGYLAKVIDSITPDDTGLLFDWSGRLIEP